MPDKTNTVLSKRLLWITVVSLVLLWVVVTGIRYFAGESDKAALGDSFWLVRINVQVKEPIQPGVVAIAAVPDDTNHIRVVGQNLIHPGWRVRFVSDPDWGIGRKMRLESTNTNARGFELGFTLRQSAAPLMQRPSLRRKLSTQAKERYLRNDSLLDIETGTLIKVINQLASGSQSNTDLLSRIFDRTQQLVHIQNTSRLRSAPEVIASGRANPLERAYTMIALCRVAHIPARLVTGFELKENKKGNLHHWVEVFNPGTGWLNYDPLHGYRQELPHNFLPFVKDRDDLVEFKSSHRITVRYTINGTDKSLDYYSNRTSGWQSIMYLTRLPLETRNVLAHLLLLPLAVLLTTLFLTLTGVRGYGTFIPALFALTFSTAEWRIVAVSMFFVLIFGVLGRSVLPAKMSRQPRLTAVLILVVVAVIASISIMDYLGWKHDSKTSLLPVVIPAIFIDLFYKELEKNGPTQALLRLFWTLVLVLICLPVMQFESLGHWLVAHPEAHLLTLAATLSITEYRGRKLIKLIK